MMYSAWSNIQAEVSTLTERLRFLLRIANYTNQRATARGLMQALDASHAAPIDITIIGKPEGGAERIAQEIHALLNPPESQAGSLRVRSSILEAADYSELSREGVARARKSSAILFIVSAVAPLFDETVEFIKREFGSYRDKIVLAVVDDEGDDALQELREAIAHYAGMDGVTVRAEAELGPALAEMLPAAHIVDELRRHVREACEQLLPAVNAFAELLSIGQPQYLRRLEFVQRDLHALATIAQQALELMESQSHTAVSNVTAVLQVLSQAMRLQAETSVHNAPIPKDALGNQDARTRLGQSIVGTARAAGYREFDARVQALAMDLNSARSLLLSSMDQLRSEAQAHLEELTLNLGAGLFGVWLQKALPGSAESPLEFSLEPGIAFPEMLNAAAAQVRKAIPDAEFSSGWTSRIEAVFKNEMVEAACAGWTSTTIDQRLAAAVAQIWEDTTRRPCGMLIGRLSEIGRVISAELHANRMGSLQLPKNESNRARLAGAYREFAKKLTEIRQEYALQAGA